MLAEDCGHRTCFATDVYGRPSISQHYKRRSLHRGRSGLAKLLKLQAFDCSVRPYDRQRVTPHHDRQRRSVQRRIPMNIWRALPWSKNLGYSEMLQTSEGMVVIDIGSISLLVGTG